MACAQIQQAAGWQERFTAMLPLIAGCLAAAFRKLPAEMRDEAIEEGIANCCVAYFGLVERGKENLAFGSALAKFAVRQVFAGRRVGGSLNSADISSAYAQRKQQFELNRLDRYDWAENCWKEILLEDRTTPILDQVCFRLDFPSWLDTLPPRDREVAECLAAGETTTAVAERLGLSLGRISQLRRTLEKSWLEFQGEHEEPEQMELLAAAS